MSAVFTLSHIPTSLITSFVFQALFGTLFGGVNDCHVPEGIWDNFKSWGGKPVDLSLHEDASEFLQRVVNLVETEMQADGQEERPLSRLFDGSYVQRVCESPFCSLHSCNVLTVQAILSLVCRLLGKVVPTAVSAKKPLTASL